MKLFKYTRTFEPEYGQTTTEIEEYYISDDIEKVECYIKGKYGVGVNERRWFNYDRGEQVNRLEELNVTTLL